MSKLNVVGMGYIGLPTALMFAAHGVEVVGTDYNAGLIDTLKSGCLTFQEDGLDALFAQALAKGIEFTTDYIRTDTYIIAVPTPYLKESKKIDPTYVVQAVKSVLEVCCKGAVVVIESTVSPGTIDRYVRPVILEAGFAIGEDIHLVHAPERIIPGNMVAELRNNSRTIGADSPAVGERIGRLYAAFCGGEIVVTDIRTAEMTKVIENTYRDINIAFSNELAKICRRDNLDVYEIIRTANKHPRVNILQPGPGVGGHCISVDPWFLVGDYPDLVQIIRSAREINDGMPDYVLERIRSIMLENGIDDLSRVGLYGLTYKENVDDVRESPTLQLLDKLAHYFVRGVKCYDPWVSQKIADGQVMDFDAFLEQVDLVVVLVAHSHIIENQQRLDGKIVYDTRNCIDRADKLYKL